MDETRRLRELDYKVSTEELKELGVPDIDINQRIQEIADYTGESPDTVVDKINDGNTNGSALWVALMPSGTKGLRDFHSGTMRKVYSISGVTDYLAVIREKVIRRILLRGKPASLLDFGGSHGHFSIAASKVGIDVTYADIGSEVRKFAKWRVKEKGLKVRFAPVRNNRCVFSNRKYDYIVCQDVASHLPNLKKYIEDFHSCLNDGGELFFGDDLYDFKVPWHLTENAVYKDPQKKQELFKDFKFVEQLWANCMVYRK